MPWFRHADAGDLTPLVEAYFDTVNAGPQAGSRVRTTRSRRRCTPAPEEVLFLTDLPAELDAARAAGWQVVGLRRPGEPNADADFGDASGGAVLRGHRRHARSVDPGGSPHERPGLPGAGAGLLEAAGRALAAESARFAAMGWMRGTSGNLSVVLTATRCGWPSPSAASTRGS